ncbi:MAG: HAD family hydrolase [Gemmatimonadaceae bacterium]
MSRPEIELLLCDVGGVLGTNGWDHDSRRLAAAHFGFEFAPVERRHEDAVDTLECGRMTLDEYLDFTVFNEARQFSPDEFRQFMLEQSVPNPKAITLMTRIAALKRYRMMTMNNESAELNEYRVDLFGLRPIFSAFITSAYIGAQKPRGNFYDRALAISHADPDRTVFIDDREENLVPARDRGVRCVRATDTDAVITGLGELGISV